jgi:hypothetical protein
MLKLLMCLAEPKPLDSAAPPPIDDDTPSKLIYLRRKFLHFAGTDDKIVVFSEFQGCLNSVVELARSVGINAAVGTTVPYACAICALF